MSNDAAFNLDTKQMTLAMRLLQEFLAPYNQLIQSTHAAFDDARLLLSEACFSLGANRCLAAAVTNRSALDSALFSGRGYRRVGFGAGINDRTLLDALRDLAEATSDPTKPYRTWVSFDEALSAISIVGQAILRIAENWETRDLDP